MKRLQQKKPAVPVNFICDAAEAGAVSVVGDFNGWNPAANPMRQHFDGSWQLQMMLPHGHHRYAFEVDGVRVLDPRATGVGRDDHGERVSLKAVS